jgi:hypothetical protein
MKKSGFAIKVIAATLLLSMLLVSASSSISVEQQHSFPSIEKQFSMEETAGMSEEEIVGISAAVIAVEGVVKDYNK